MISETVRAEWRNHWQVVAGVFVGLALAYPSWAFVQSQFVQPLQDEFGWSRAAIAAAFGANLLICWTAPLYGRLIDRFGVRPILLTCLVLLAIGYVAMANFQGSYPLFFGIFLFVLTVGLGTTGISYTRAIAGWFEASRGTALAISRIGMSAAGAAMPIIMFHVIDAHGWRAGYYLLAGIVVFGSLPFSFAWVRDRRPDAKDVKVERKTTELKTWLSIISDRRVIFLCLAATFTYGPAIGILASLQPLLTLKGLEPAVAASLAAVIALSVLAGTLITGLLVDRVWAPLVGCVFTLFPVVGCLMLLPGEVSMWWAAVAIVLVGLAQGAEIDVVAYMIARYFGMKAYALVYGLGVLMMTIATSVFAVGFGRIFDVTGSYNLALIISAGTFFLGAVSYLLVGRYPAVPGIKGIDALPSDAERLAEAEKRD